MHDASLSSKNMSCDYPSGFNDYLTVLVVILSINKTTGKTILDEKFFFFDLYLDPHPLENDSSLL